MQAVESEFSGVLQSDAQRLEQLRCHTAQPGHILNRFAWGNTASLKTQPLAAGVNVRSQLLQYYRCCSLLLVTAAYSHLLQPSARPPCAEDGQPARKLCLLGRTAEI